MRRLSTLLLAFAIIGCTTQKQPLNQQQFAAVYLDSLRKAFPEVTFQLQPDLSIQSKKDSFEYKHYITNAYAAYQSSPDSLASIISGYMAASADLFTPQKPIDPSRIVAVIKPADYIEEARELSNTEKGISLVFEPYNPQLVIVYVEDAETNLRYLTPEDFEKLSISKDSLRKLAIKNLRAVLPQVERHENKGVFMVTAGGIYEASLLLLPTLWTAENFAVNGQMVVGIPTRDLLLVTGSKHQAGIAKIKEVIAESYPAGSYPISNQLFKWTGQKFELFE